jgi:hypothetical protein
MGTTVIRVCPFPMADTYLILRNGPQFARSRSLPHRSASRNLGSPCHCIRVRDPITNLVRYDFDNRYTWVILVALVDTILQVTKVCSETVVSSSACGRQNGNNRRTALTSVS